MMAGWQSCAIIPTRDRTTSSTDLWDCWRQAREGQSNVDRNITVTLLDEERYGDVELAVPERVPVNYRVTPLDASSSDVAVEELILTFDSMDIE
jgi:phage tail-like protein